MNEQQIKEWYSQRVPLSGRLSDYAMLIGQNNMVLSSLWTKQTASPLTVPPRQNRVGIWCFCDANANGVGNSRVVFSFSDDAGNSLVDYSILSSVVDALGTTQAIMQYNPLLLNVTDIGPIIQRRIDISRTGATFFINLVELIMSPKCCDYIGGMK